MNTLEDHEASRVAGQGQPPLRRLLGYTRPYVGAMLVALALSGVLSGSRYVRAWLMKPIFDEIVLPSASLGEVSLGSWLPGAKQAPAAPPAAAAEARSATPPAAAPAADTVAPRERLERVQDAFQRVLLIALVIVFGTPLVLFAHEYLIQYVLGRIDLDMKVDVCGKILALPLRFHQSRQRGDLLQRILGDTNRSQAAIELLFSDFLEAAVMIAVGLGALLLISWQLTLVMLGVGPVIALVISTFGRRIRRSARRRQEQAADVTQRLVEIISGIKVVKAFRAERQENQAFGRSANRLFRRGMKVTKNRVMARSLVDALNNASAMGVLVLGIWLVLGQRWGLTAGDLGAFVAMTSTIYRPLRTLSRGYVKLVDAQPSAERYFQLLDAQVEIRDAEDAKPIPRMREGVRFRNVTFSYGREPVLQNVSLEAKSGEVVAIVGRTGAGKTTLTDLLLRLYDPQEGSVEIDGVDLRRVRRDSLLDQMAVVTQEPFLFDGTIADNIRYGRLGASDEEVLSAARAANVDEFVGNLPDGYETQVGGGGARLSGGQRQRVTIARAILRNPAILILDEATSALDSKAERSVQDALDALLPGRTAFVIAHRLATVRRADKIVVLEGGRIIQSGTHEELLAAGGLYRDLVELQNASPDDARLRDGADVPPPGGGPRGRWRRRERPPLS